MSKDRSDLDSGESKGCSCPFCDAPAEKLYPFCKDCGKALSHCKICGKPLPPHMDICGECGD